MKNRLLPGVPVKTSTFQYLILKTAQVQAGTRSHNAAHRFLFQTSPFMSESKNLQFRKLAAFTVSLMLFSPEKSTSFHVFVDMFLTGLFLLSLAELRALPGAGCGDAPEAGTGSAPEVGSGAEPKIRCGSEPGTRPVPEAGPGAVPEAVVVVSSGDRSCFIQPVSG